MSVSCLVVGRFLAVQPGHDVFELFGVFRVDVNHPFGIYGRVLFLGCVRAAHASSDDIPHHVLSAHGAVVGFAHEFAEQFHFVLAQFVACSQGIRCNLSHSLQDFIAVSSDIELRSVLEVAVVVLEAFACGVFHGAEHIVDCTLQVGGVFCQAGAVDPVQGDVRAVGSRPFLRFASVFEDAFERFASMSSGTCFFPLRIWISSTPIFCGSKSGCATSCRFPDLAHTSIRAL